MEPNVEKCIEGGSNDLSNMSVGIGDIFERDVTDKRGVVARRTSVELFIHDPSTKAEHRETVSAGSVVAIGTDQYCVVEVEHGKQKNESGWVSLRKIVR